MTIDIWSWIISIIAALTGNLPTTSTTTAGPSSTTSLSTTTWKPVTTTTTFSPTTKISSTSTTSAWTTTTTTPRLTTTLPTTTSKSTTPTLTTTTTSLSSSRTTTFSSTSAIWTTTSKSTTTPVSTYGNTSINTTSTTVWTGPTTSWTSTWNSNTTVSTSSTSTSAISTSAVPFKGNVQADILVIARDSSSATDVTSGLNGYGIPFQVLLVPQAGATLPNLNTTNGGNFGGIVVLSQVTYDYGTNNGGYRSALTSDQWAQLYAYQTTYGVRMVQLDVFPSPLFGTSALGGCCNTGVEQLMSFTNTTEFAQAGLREDATVSTQNLYHYPATITDPSTTYEIAGFAGNADFLMASTAAVINNFNGRQQMAFFISWATEWSTTSNFLQHAYITWMTRGLYAGIRRVNYNTQIDDMFLVTNLYKGNGSTYRVTPGDMSSHVSWIPQIQSKMNAGSYYLPEIGHNGNGNIIKSQSAFNSSTICYPGPIDTGVHGTTPVEFKKPLGSGTSYWPTTPAVYPYSTACVNADPLKNWFSTPSNRDSFMHISHTFTHYALNNATYSDALKEIQFNQAWFQQVGIAAGKFSTDGLIPPAITGTHNGDVLRAWTDAGLNHCVGDNTRPLLRDPVNDMYALRTNMADSGFDGFNIIPRWATRIYYDCDTPLCTLQEWIDTSTGYGTFQTLLDTEKAEVTRHLLGLYHDGYMFHQANLRIGGLSPITVNGITSNISLFQAWVETTVQEFVRLVNWPMITLRQTDLAKSFIARRARDSCNYKLSWFTSDQKITGVTVSADGNTCSEAIPLTLPSSVTDLQGSTTEQIGNDPLTIWVKLSGAPKTFWLTKPVAW